MAPACGGGGGSQWFTGRPGFDRQFVSSLVFWRFCSCLDAPAPAPSQELLEKEFEETLSGAVLEGSFTINGRESDPLRTERYEINSVTKLAGSLWTINTRIQYGSRDVTVAGPGDGRVGR